jgi:hypothetical protein
MKNRVQKRTFYIPLAKRATRGELGDRGEPALGAHPLARGLTLGLRHFEHGRPAEIAALGALGSLEMVEAIAACHTGGAALQALDYHGIHTLCIGRVG